MAMRRKNSHLEFRPTTVTGWSKFEREGKCEVLLRDVRLLMKQCADLEFHLGKEKEKAGEDKKGIFLDIVEILDRFDELFKAITPKEQEVDRQTKIWLGNFRSRYKSIERLLKKYGVVPIESSVGKKALPGVQFIKETVHREDMEDEAITEELRKGYMWHKGVLREAEVVVVKNSND